MTMTAENRRWDDELDYCIRLVANKGAIGVPFETIALYLETQSAQARRDHAPKLSKALADAASYWKAGDYGLSKTTLRMAYLLA